MSSIYKQLETIIEHGIRNNPLPYKKGNSIRVGKIAIRHSSKDRYVVIDCENNRTITTAFTLRGALAFAKKHDRAKDLPIIRHLDRKYYKNLNDCVFYKSTLENTGDTIKKNVVRDRLEIAEDELSAVARSLEDIIFDYKR